MKIVFMVLFLAVTAFGQTPQPQATPQQIVSGLVTQQARLSADVITTLNQIPDLITKIEALQKQVAELQAEIATLKKEKK